MEYYSPLRYPGGKGSLSPFIQNLFEANYLCDGYYVEPFAGGASIALSLLINDYVRRIIINDIDRAIYAFWYAIFNYTEDFCRLIEKVPLSINEWTIQKTINRNLNSEDLLSLGFSTFYLNRTNHSGILNGGVIGGIHQRGKYRIDARFNKKGLINRIERIALFSDRIVLYNLDACDLLERISNTLPKKTLVYIDPPYYTKGKALYHNYFKHEDHEKVSRTIKKISMGSWIVSYDNKDEIRKMYNGYRLLEYSLDYCAHKRTKGKEVMFFSKNVFLPEKILRFIPTGVFS